MKMQKITADEQQALYLVLRSALHDLQLTQAESDLIARLRLLIWDGRLNRLPVLTESKFKTLE